MYNIYQVRISDEITQFANSPEGGHSETAKKFPIYDTCLKTRHGSDEYEPEMFEHYTKVCVVDNFGGSTLEDVFKVLNGYYWDDEQGCDPWFDSLVTGFKMKKIVETGDMVRDMHSLSVGDIVENANEGTFHIVNVFGFEEIQTIGELVS